MVSHLLALPLLLAVGSRLKPQVLVAILVGLASVPVVVPLPVAEMVAGSDAWLRLLLAVSVETVSV